MSEQKLEVFNVLNFLNSGYELEDILNEDDYIDWLEHVFLDKWGMPNQWNKFNINIHR